MAGNPNIDRLIATTIEKYIPRAEDNIFTSKPWLFALTTFGNVETLDGGTIIRQPLLYRETSNQGPYTGADVFLTDDDEGHTAADFEWRGYYVTIKLNNMDLRKNSGAPAILRIVEQEMKRAELSVSESLDEMFIGNGSGINWNGLGNLVSDTVSLGGIDPTAGGNEWWQSDVTGSVGDLTSFDPIREAYLTVSEGNDFPQAILTTQDIYAAVDELFEQRQRFGDPTMASQGFETIKFHNAPVFFDRNVTAGEMFGVNLKYFYLYKLGDAWFKQSDWEEPLNQDVKIKKIILNGQLVISNRKRQFKLTGITIP